MNEFPGPGQQPAGNPRRPPTRSERDETIRKGQEEEKEERARRQAVLADGPVRVRIVWDAGMSSPVARGLGQAERDWFRSLVGPGPGAWKVRDVTKSALEGFVLDSPAQHQIAVQKIANTMIVFLGQAPRLADRGPFAAAPAPRDTPPGVRLVWDVGMSSPATRKLGMAERDWFGSVRGPGPPGPHRVRDVQYLDFTLSAEDGFVVDSPALPHIAVDKTADEINVLLVPARPRDPLPFPPAEISPLHKPGPGSPVRNPGI